MFRSLGLRLCSVVVVIAVVACGSSSSDAPAGGGDGGTGATVASCTVTGRAGQSSCTADAPPGFPAKAPISCSAGTVCVTADFDARCEGGCMSDENCGPSERCVRCGKSSVGSCRPCNQTDEEVCADKPVSKPDAGKATCERNTFFDRECAAPGKAFECSDTTIEPTGQGTCVQTSLPEVFCCGGGLASQCRRETTLDAPLCQMAKAYHCPPGEEPTGTCSLAPDGATYCCE